MQCSVREFDYTSSPPHPSVQCYQVIVFSRSAHRIIRSPRLSYRTTTSKEAMRLTSTSTLRFRYTRGWKSYRSLKVTNAMFFFSLGYDNLTTLPLPTPLSIPSPLPCSSLITFTQLHRTPLSPLVSSLPSSPSLLSPRSG